MRRSFMLFFLLYHAFSGMGQPAGTNGKEFWVTFSENLATPQMTLYFSAMQQAVVTIRNPNTAYTKTITVPANTMVSELIPAAQCYNTGSGIIANKGLKVTSTTDITVYAFSYAPASSDATFILPVKALGLTYRVMTYEGITSPFNMYGAGFCIVATQDNTQIRITPNVGTLDGRLPNVPYIITLNEGQSYKVQCAGGYDMTGTLIEVQNCKPVAVFGTTVCAFIPQSCFACDHLFEQLFPVKNWGKEFILIPTASRLRDRFVVLADKSNTVISVNGLSRTLALAGDKYEGEISAPAYITSNEPVCVFIYAMGRSCAGSTGDPMMMWVTPVEQKINNIIFASPSSALIQSHYVNIVARTSTIQSVKMNGVSIGGLATVLGFNPAYSYVQKQINSGTNSITSDSGFTAYAYGYGNAESYGYNVGSSIYDLTHYSRFDSLPPEVCKNSPFTFRGFSYGGTPLYWLWTFNNDSAYGQNVVKTFTDTGLVKVTLLVAWNEKNECRTSDTSYDTTMQYVRITEPLVQILNPDTMICRGSVFQARLSCTGCTGVNWTGGTDLSCTGCMNPYISSPVANRWYKVQAEGVTGCIREDSFFVQVIDTVNVDIVYDSLVCQGTETKIHARVLSPDTSYHYLYVLYAGNSLLAQDTSGKFAVKADSNIVLKLQTQGFCSGENQIFVRVQPNPLAAFSVSDTAGCEPVTVQFTGNSLTYAAPHYNWSFGDRTSDTAFSPTHTYKQPAVYTVSLRVSSDLGCADTAIRHAAISVYPVPRIRLAIDPRVVKITNGKISFSTQLSHTNLYDFDYGDGNAERNQTTPVNHFIHVYTDTGYHIVKLNAANYFGCTAELRDSLFVEDIFTMFVPNAFTPGNTDGVNDRFKPVTTFSKLYDMSIFDRWGQLIYTESCNDRWYNCKGWDGTYKGHMVEDGVYVYMLAIHEETGQHHYETGTVTILH